MPSKKLRWAINRADGTPIILNGVIAEVDEETGDVHLDERTAQVVKEVIDHGPQRVAMVIVPMADFAEEVHRLIVDKRARSPLHQSDSTPKPYQETPHEYLSGTFQNAVDLVLRMTYSQFYRYSVLLFGKGPEIQSVKELREGPLGQDLEVIKRIALGEISRDQKELLRAVEAVIELLFWPAGEEYPSVPREFWDTIGEVLVLALFRVLGEEQFLGAKETATLLGTSRSKVYRWVDERILRSYQLPDQERLYILRQDVEKLLAEAEKHSDDVSKMSIQGKPQKQNPLVVWEPRKEKLNDSENLHQASLLG